MVDYHTPERLRWLRIQSWKWRQMQQDDLAALILVACVLGLILTVTM